MIRIYLAGTLTGRPRTEVLEERQIATTKLKAAGFEVFDPVSLEDSTTREDVFEKPRSLQEMANFIASEKEALQQCDAVLVLTGDHASDGTWLEMGYALYSLQLPVVLISPLRSQGQVVSWSNVEATGVVASIDDAVQFLQAYLEQVHLTAQQFLETQRKARLTAPREEP